ncbi:MAG: vWA domain-containing protein [Oceanihabitans sp.]
MKSIFKTSLLALFVISIIACQAKTKNQEIALATPKPLATKPNKQFIKVALLLDTSNSMDGLIDQAKAQLWEIVNELSYAKCEAAKPSLQIALYEYGNDKLNVEKGYIRQVLAFSQDLDEISKQLFSLTTNGGSEYCGQVIETSLNQLKWGDNPDDLKLIFIAGNEPFTQGKVNYKLASKKAHTKDVTVNTIFCGDYNHGINSYWKDGADLTHGEYMAINHNQATVHIASPFDDTLLELNNKLNKTYVAYGKNGLHKMALQAEQDQNAEGYSKANAVSRTISKSSHLYKNTSWDLIDASEEAEFDYKKLKDSQLPKVLKGKTEKEIKDYLNIKRKEREAIQKEIKTLNLKRKEYIANQQKEGSTNLENAMLGAIKAQAVKKNYKWE